MPKLSIFEPTLPQKPGEALRYGELYGASAGLLASQAIQTYQGISVLITTDNRSAQLLEAELRFFCSDPKQLTILNFPDWETLPYDIFSPHQDIISERIKTLSRLPQLTRGVLIVPIRTLLQRLAPKEYIGTHAFNLKLNDKLDPNQLKRDLEFCGYRSVAQVMEHGEYTSRGSIIDLFPMGSTLPYRIDLLDEEVESIRTFDPDTQLTIEKVSDINLLPAREFPLTEQAIADFRKSWRTRFDGNPVNCPIYQDVSQGICPTGIEYYLPLFFEQTSNLFEYLPKNCLLLSIGDLSQAADHFWAEIKERYDQRCHDITRPLLAPEELYLPVAECLGKLRAGLQIKLQETAYPEEQGGRVNCKTAPAPTVLIDHRAAAPLQALNHFIADYPGRVLLIAETAGRREALLELLKASNIHPKACSSWQDFSQEALIKLGICIAPLQRGLSLLEPALVLITESQLFGEHSLQQRRRLQKTQDSDAIVRNLAELSIGSPVVHIDHGVGRYLGLQTLTVNDRTDEFLQLEYAEGAKLYVPVASLDLISRYSGADLEHAPLHRLGNELWQKAKRKAAEQVQDVAAELLDVYAQRAARKGHAFPQPDQSYHQFAAGFQYEETPDQERAIREVIADLTAAKPMDRLICGDVGFGKTEVALRAAFLTVQGDKQVAVLVPTTLLAQQHYETFSDRFADSPIRVELISRFRTKKEQQAVIENLKTGKVDILIGTHALIQEGIQFSNLGLLIIDEEHRFGVKQKEKLKALRAEVDILTLTATPIPRTLNMAMSGLRELSIIATPPARRLSIKTFVHEHEKSLVREAILREILRGGQVYYLHNKVETIEKTADHLRELVPEARIRVGHGQLHERELEAVMADFYHQRFNVLVCSTIIETGLDIPSANTIIIDRADMFGLAQLHQLRGRVGRSHHQAYAYLLTPPEKLITPDAQKRLEAIAALEDLGVGFSLATHDLEIRGAGELLGEGQSGNMQAIGFSLYMELLEQAVDALKNGKDPAQLQPLRHGVEIDLQMPALIPENYLPDVHTRLILYKRIASAPRPEILRELQVEMIDRFGLLPEPVKNLFRIASLKIKTKPLGIKKIEAGPLGGRIEFGEQANINTQALIGLIQKQAQYYKLDGAHRLRYSLPSKTLDERIAVLDGILDRLVCI